MPFADKRSKIKKPISIALGLVFFGFVGIIGGITYIRHLPVDYDAGACSGGYAAFIFDKYKEELVKKYYDGMEDNSDISSIKAVQGTQAAEWEGRTLFLQFDIQYKSSIQGTVSERIGFIGQRIWFDTYDWSSAIVQE